MRAQILFLAVLVLILNSCFLPESKVDFEIINHSERSFDSLYVTNYTNKSISKNLLGQDDSLNLEIKFQNVEPKGDGSYGFIAYRDKDSIYTNFGYYTNGYPLAEWYRIEILSDTILISELNKK